MECSNHNEKRSIDSLPAQILRLFEKYDYFPQKCRETSLDPLSEKKSLNSLSQEILQLCNKYNFCSKCIEICRYLSSQKISIDSLSEEIADKGKNNFTLENNNNISLFLTDEVKHNSTDTSLVSTDPLSKKILQLFHVNKKLCYECQEALIYHNINYFTKDIFFKVARHVPFDCFRWLFNACNLNNEDLAKKISDLHEEYLSKKFIDNIEKSTWIKFNNCYFNQFTFQTVVQYISSDCIIWLKHEINCPYDARTLMNASFKSDLKIMKLLCDEKKYLTSSVFYLSLLMGDKTVVLEILDFLHENECPYNNGLFASACNKGNFDILNWLKLHNYKYDYNLCMEGINKYSKKAPIIREWVEKNLVPGFINITL